MSGRRRSETLVIIGAGRSGTNMLRDLLCGMPGVGSWPCDEINYIWRHGNRHAATDEFPASAATETVRRYIRGSFDAMRRRLGAELLVEKTCANSLRVPFVDAVLPEARYVFIVRDGRDVVASAAKRWTAPLDLGYIAAKARFVPASDIPYYASRYLANRVARVLRPDRRLASWGPRFEGMQQIGQEHGLAALCAAQWSRCATLADDALAKVRGDRILRVRYEDFVLRPREEAQRLAAFAGVAAAEDVIARVASEVSTSSVGRWRLDMDAAVLSRSMPFMGPALERFGYGE